MLRFFKILVLMVCWVNVASAAGREVRSTNRATAPQVAQPGTHTLEYNQDVLLNPSPQAPRINGPSFNSGTNDLMRYFAQQRTAPQQNPATVPAHPIDNPGMLMRAYNATVGYVQPAMQSGRTVIRNVWNWTAARLEEIKQSFLTYQQARRDGSCQAQLEATRRYGPRANYPRAGMCCKAAVNDVLSARGVIPRRIRSNLAKDSIPDIRTMKNSRGGLVFKDITNEIGRDTSRAPIMTVLVYGGPGPGHMEVRTERGYESDFVGEQGIDKRRRDRPLIGAFAVVDPERK